MPPDPARPVRSAWRRAPLAAAVVLAVLAGVAGATLAGVAPTVPAPRPGQLEIDLPTSVWGLLFVAPLAVGLSVLALRSFGERSGRGALVRPAVTLAVAVGFVFLLLAVSSSSGGGGGGSVVWTSPTGGSNTTSQTNGSHGGSGNGTGSSASTQIFTLSLPPWSLSAFVIGLVALVGVLAVPGVLARLVDRRASLPRPRLQREVVAAAMGEAATAIGRGDDPRATIVRLYARLLGVVGSKIGDVDPLTATEIGARLVEELGVRAPASQTLTGLFEEARYSTHPMGPEAAGRCRDAVVAVESDLMHRPPAAGRGALA